MKISLVDFQEKITNSLITARLSHSAKRITIAINSKKEQSDIPLVPALGFLTHLAIDSKFFIATETIPASADNVESGEIFMIFGDKGSSFGGWLLHDEELDLTDDLQKLFDMELKEYNVCDEIENLMKIFRAI